MYTLNFFGEKYQVSGRMWFSVMIPLALFGLYLFYCMGSGLWAFGGPWGVLGLLLLCGEVHYNQTRYRLIHNDRVRKSISIVAGLFGIIYHFFG